MYSNKIMSGKFAESRSQAADRPWICGKPTNPAASWIQKAVGLQSSDKQVQIIFDRKKLWVTRILTVRTNSFKWRPSSPKVLILGKKFKTF